ncbi:unnamed protein product [Arctogadus glacialis]
MFECEESGRDRPSGDIDKTSWVCGFKPFIALKQHLDYPSPSAPTRPRGGGTGHRTGRRADTGEAGYRIGPGLTQRLVATDVASCQHQLPCEPTQVLRKLISLSDGLMKEIITSPLVRVPMCGPPRVGPLVRVPMCGPPRVFVCGPPGVGPIVRVHMCRSPHSSAVLLHPRTEPSATSSFMPLFVFQMDRRCVGGRNLRRPRALKVSWGWPLRQDHYGASLSCPRPPALPSSALMNRSLGNKKESLDE